jgi:hypothetical protein
LIDAINTLLGFDVGALLGGVTQESAYEGDLPFLQLRDSVEYIERLDPGSEGEMTVTFPLKVWETAASDSYSYPVSFLFQDEGGSNQAVRESMVGIEVRGTPRFEIVSVNTRPSTVEAGESFRMELQIQNIGDLGVQGTRVSIWDSEQERRLSSIDFLGNMAAGSVQIAMVDMPAGQQGHRDWELRIEYAGDSEGEFELAVKEVGVYVHPASTEIAGTSWVLFVVFLVVLVLIIWLIWRRLRRRNEEEEEGWHNGPPSAAGVTGMGQVETGFQAEDGGGMTQSQSWQPDEPRQEVVDLQAAAPLFQGEKPRDESEPMDTELELASSDSPEEVKPGPADVGGLMMQRLQESQLERSDPDTQEEAGDALSLGELMVQRLQDLAQQSSESQTSAAGSAEVLNTESLKGAGEAVKEEDSPIIVLRQARGLWRWAKRGRGRISRRVSRRRKSSAWWAKVGAETENGS